MCCSNVFFECEKVVVVYTYSRTYSQSCHKSCTQSRHVKVAGSCDLASKQVSSQLHYKVICADSTICSGPTQIKNVDKSLTHMNRSVTDLHMNKIKQTHAKYTGNIPYFRDWNVCFPSHYIIKLLIPMKTKIQWLACFSCKCILL